MKLFYFTMLWICLIVFVGTGVYAQCAQNDNIYSFEMEGKRYDIVKENKTWIEAAACALEMGGRLAEVKNQQQQVTIFTQVVDSAQISMNRTIAPDGGGGAYLWLGGNDIDNEGEWLWNGDNNGESEPFWRGMSFDGAPVNNAYVNWGTQNGNQTEPDDFGGSQDALALSLNGWPLGSAGQWNDVGQRNRLYYIVEYPLSSSAPDSFEGSDIKILSNPANNVFYVKSPRLRIINIQLYSVQGKLIYESTESLGVYEAKVDVAHLSEGVYIMSIRLSDGSNWTKSISK